MERIASILSYLEQQKAIHLKELAEMLQVAEITVRRTVNESNVGLKIVGGYVILDDALFDDTPKREEEGNGYSLLAEMRCRIEEKRHIAQLTVNYIDDNDTIFLDHGSTATYVAEYLPKDLSCTVICYSFSVAAILKQKPLINFILLGGKYNRQDQVFYGFSEEILKNIRIKKSFISCSGLSERLGVMESHKECVEIKKKAMAISQKTYLIADISSFDGLITNPPPEELDMTPLEEGGLKIIS